MSETGKAPLYRRPTWVRRAVVNPIARRVVLRGRGGTGEQNLMRLLRVAGRVSGRPHDVPVRVAMREGERYVVSLLGETEWARNLRAAGSAVLVHGDEAVTVTAQELSPEQGADFLRWYCTVPDHALSVRAGLRLDRRRPDPEALLRAARDHPVFRLVPGGAPL